MTVAERIKMTAEQYLQLEKDPPGIRLELVNGEILASPSPDAPHAWAVSQLLYTLIHHVRTNDSGVVMSDTDHVLTEHDVRRPDIYFFANDRVHLIEKGPIRHPPDLAVEIVSPSSVKTDRISKFNAYRDFGVPYYWIIDPAGRTAEAFQLRRKKYASAGSGRGTAEVSFPPFQDLVISLRELWWPPTKRKS